MKSGFGMDLPGINPGRMLTSDANRLLTNAKPTPDLLYFALSKVAPTKFKDLKEMAAFIPELQCQFYLKESG